MDEIIKDLIEAVQNVDVSILRYRTIGGFEIGENIEDNHDVSLSLRNADPDLIEIVLSAKNFIEKISERAFCYELYHQWRLIIERNPVKYRDLFVSPEIYKTNLLSILNAHEFFSNEELNEFKKAGLFRLDSKQTYYYPDFVLHGSYEDFHNQLIAIEVKTARNLSYDNFKKDVYKLITYIRLLQYKRVIYILTDIKIIEIREYLSYIPMIEELNYSFESIDFHFVFKFSNTNEIETYTLSELM
jgi:hypothetical protein